MQDFIRNWSANLPNAQKVKQLFKSILSLKNKHQLAEQVHQEVFQEFDCLQCANCCKSIPPIISKRDEKRISKYLNISVKDFQTAYVVVDEDGDSVFKTTPCVFLEEDNKCKIYDVRPSACRQYPHSGELNFYKNISLHKRNLKYCPALLEIVTRLAAIKAR